MHFHILIERESGSSSSSSKHWWCAVEIICEIILAEYAPNDYQTEAMFICK